MTSAARPGISGLPEELGGLVLALALATPAGAEDPEAWRREAAARVAGRAGELCRAALAELEAQPRAERAQTLSRLVQRVTAPVPAGIARVHPSWLRAALEGEATEVLVAVTGDLPAAAREVAGEIIEGRGDAVPLQDPVRVPAGTLDELRRAIFSGLVAMPDPVGAPAEWQRLAALPGADLLGELARAGAEALGASLAGAPPAVLARAAVQAGDAWADTVLAAARREVTPELRARARALVAGAASLAGAGAGVGALAPIQAAGLLELARHLSGELPSAARAVAQRLPLALGQILLERHQRRLDPA
jgi:hypothetical protein